MPRYVSSLIVGSEHKGIQMNQNPRDYFFPRQFTKAWLAQNDVEVISNGELRSSCKSKADQLKNKMWLDYNEQIIAHNATEVIQNHNPRDRKIAKPCTQKDLEMAIEEICEAVKLEERIKIFESLKCSQENLDPVKTFCAALGSQNDVDIDVICHFIWAIKRKMSDQEVTNHIFPVLYSSAHGVGKSTAIEKILSPISSHVIDVNFKQLTDDRYSLALAESFVARVEELSGWSAKSEIEALKNVITCKTLTYRKLGTNSVFNVPNRASFIGSTNRRLNLIIVDSQNRRFHEIEVSKINWELINEIDYVKLFQGIDEQKPEGYLHGESLTRLRKSQEQLASKPQMEEFFQEFSLRLPENKDTKFITADEIFKAYCDFVINSGISNRFTKQTLGKQLSNYGFKSFSKKVNGKTANCYEICSSCEIPSSLTTTNK